MSMLSPRNVSVGAKIGFGFLLALGATLAVCLVAFDTGETLLSNSDWVSHTHKVLGKLSRVSALLSSAEAEVRGYALTGEQSYLEEHPQLSSDLRTEMAAVVELTRDNTVQ